MDNGPDEARYIYVWATGQITVDVIASGRNGERTLWLTGARSGTLGRPSADLAELGSRLGGWMAEHGATLMDCPATDPLGVVLLPSVCTEEDCGEPLSITVSTWLDWDGVTWTVGGFGDESELATCKDGHELDLTDLQQRVLHARVGEALEQLVPRSTWVGQGPDTQGDPVWHTVAGLTDGVAVIDHVKATDAPEAASLWIEAGRPQERRRSVVAVFDGKHQGLTL